MSLVELFGYWQRYACLTSKFMPCNQHDENLTYIVLRDLNPEHTKQLLSTEATHGNRLLLIQHIESGKKYIAKLILDYSCNTEYHNYVEISKLARSKLPNIMPLINYHQICDDESNDALHILIMNEGIPFTTAYRKLTDLSEFRDMKQEFWLSQAFQMLYALAFLHYNMFQHRDIHYGNFVYALDQRPEVSESYAVDDVYFNVKTEFLGVKTTLQLLDFGLTAWLLNDAEAMNTTAYVVANRPPDFIFADSRRVLAITNNDELFAYGLWLYFSIYSRFEFQAYPLKYRLVTVFDGLRGTGLQELYRDYSSEDLAEQAIVLVLLMGFPSQQSSYFYQSRAGQVMLEHKTLVVTHPGYNIISMLSVDSCVKYGKIHEILKRVLKWERCDRPATARELLLSPGFESLRSPKTTNAWNVFI